MKKTLEKIKKLSVARNASDKALRDEIRKALLEINKKTLKKMADNYDYYSYELTEFGDGRWQAGDFDDLDIETVAEAMDKNDSAEIVLDELKELLFEDAMHVDNGTVWKNDGECLVIDSSKSEGDVTYVYLSSAPSLRDNNHVQLGGEPTDDEIKAACKKVAGDNYFPNVFELSDKYGNGEIKTGIFND